MMTPHDDREKWDRRGSGWSRGGFRPRRCGSFRRGFLQSLGLPGPRGTRGAGLPFFVEGATCPTSVAAFGVDDTVPTSLSVHPDDAGEEYAEPAGGETRSSTRNFGFRHRSRPLNQLMRITASKNGNDDPATSVCPSGSGGISALGPTGKGRRSASGSRHVGDGNPSSEINGRSGSAV